MSEIKGQLQAAYELFRPGTVDAQLLGKTLARYGVSPDQEVLMLPYGEHNRIGFEIRKLYFAPAVGADGTLSPHNRLPGSSNSDLLPTNRIISFGDCNVACGYCKRDMQFVGDNGVPIASLAVPVSAVAALSEGAVGRGETVRFSGGDPVMYPKVTLALAEYLYTRHGEKVSIAHNGSGTRWVEKLSPYLSSAAIDLKAVPDKIGHIMGVSPEKGKILFQKSLATQRVVSGKGILLDVRTPIFGDTTQQDMERLGEAIVGTNDLRYTFWTWRMYKPVVGCDFSVPERDTVIDLMTRVSEKLPDLWMGMRAKWNRGGMLFVKGGEVISQTSDIEKAATVELGSGNGISFPGSLDTRQQLAVFAGK